MSKSAIVAIAKNEELYLQEWIDYHKNLGFDYIFVCDNNDEDNEKHLDIIRKNAPECYGIDVRGREKLEKIGLQTGVYVFALNYIKEHFKDIEWIAFIDIDEFLSFDGMKANTFLGQDKFKDTDLIHLNWKCYGDNENIFYVDKPVLERFTTPLPEDVLYGSLYIKQGLYLNKHVKSILRVNDHFKQFATPHTILFQDDYDCTCKNVAGDLVNNKSPFQSICYNGGHIKHFITKSTEEFIKRKLSNNTRADATFNSKIDEELDHYFAVNTKTWSKWCLIETLVLSNKSK